MGQLREEHSHHIHLFGEKHLSRAREKYLCIIGLGGTGSALLHMLAAVGFQKFSLWDNDRIELSNLPRQFLYTRKDLGRYKIDVAADTMKTAYPEIMLDIHYCRFTHEHTNLLQRYDIVICASDDFITFYLVHDFCKAYSVPFFGSSVVGFQGYVFRTTQYDPACFRCLFPYGYMNPLQGCSDTGVCVPLVRSIADMQALQIMFFTFKRPMLPAPQCIFMQVLPYASHSIDVVQDTSCKLCCTQKKIHPKDLHPCEITWEKYEYLIHLKGTFAIFFDHSVKIEDRNIFFVHFPKLKEFMMNLPIPTSSINNLIFVCTRGFRSYRAGLYCKAFGFPFKIFSVQGGVSSCKSPYF